MRNFSLVIIVFLLCTTAAWPHEVLVIQGLRVKPYDEAYRGFMSSCDADTRRVYLPDIDKRALSRLVLAEKPRLILAIGADALARVQKIRGIPVVYLMVLNPQSIIHSSSNFTGVDMNVPPEKYLDLLAQVIPSPKKIGIIYDPAKTGDLIRRAKQAAAARDLEISALAVTRANDVPQALDSLKGRADALLILPDTTVVTPETVESFLIFSQNNNVPVIAFAAKYVEMGALLSLDIDSADQGRQAGELARRILNGTPVSALPPTEARSTHLKVNRNVANKLGISLLAGATKEY